MKIGLLAATGAGKTSFLTGLYGIFTRDWNANASYGVRFSVSDSLQRGILTDRFKTLVKGQDSDDSGTKTIEKYGCRLTTAGADGIPRDIDIEIVDFPGGAIEGANSEEGKKDVELIIEELAHCDGFIVLFDGSGFLKGVFEGDNYRLEQATKSDEIRLVLHQAIEKRRKRAVDNVPDGHAFGQGKLPICFVLTKYDVIENSMKDADIRARFDEFRKNCMLATKSEANVEQGVFPLYIQKNFQIFTNDENIASAITVAHTFDAAGDRFAPFNLEHPFQFILFAGLLNAVAEYERRIGFWTEELASQDLKHQELLRINLEARDRYERRKAMSAETKVVELLGKAWRSFVINDTIGEIIKGVEYASTDTLRKKYNETVKPLNETAQTRDAALVSRNEAQRQLEIASYFLERILSEELVYRLNSYDLPKVSYYARGLPIDLVRGYEWWWERAKRGKAELLKKYPFLDNPSAFYVNASGEAFPYDQASTL